MEDFSRRLQALLWPERLPHDRAAAALIKTARYAFALARDFAAGELSLRAMSLVYSTMLAIVPLLAFSFVIAKGLGLHRQLEPLLLTFLEPIGPRAGEISTNVIEFVDNISGSVLASLSIGLLLIFALSMAQKVESSFNFVWRVDRPRSLARRFSEYVSVMFVGPIVMAIATGLIAALSSAAFVEKMRQLEPFGSMIAALSDSTPYLLVIAAFSILYLIIPNTKVRFRPALIGGTFAGIGWAASGQLFAALVVTSTRYEAIYSGFAIVIVLMFWLYLSWLILLLGSQLAFYLQNPYHLRLGLRREPMSNSLRERLAINAMLLVGRDFAHPAHGWRTESLAAELRLPSTSLEPIMAALTDGDLLAQTSDLRLVPARDPRRISINDVVDAVRRQRDGHGSESGEWNATVDDLARRIDGAIEDVLLERTLADLVDEDVAREQAMEPE